MMPIVALVAWSVGMATWQSLAMWLFPGPVIATGRVLDGRSVIDGDTLNVGGRPIRLEGIDAPELHQTCADGWPAGQESRRALAAIATSGAVRCRRVTTDRYGRTVAFCSVDGRDLGAVLVRSGMAWAYTTYSWRYLLDEWQAWFDGLGVHGQDCIGPAAWRAGHPS